MPACCRRGRRATALTLSREVRGDARERRRAPSSSRVLYGDEPRQWRDDLDGLRPAARDRQRCTRLRFCTADGAMEFTEKRGRGARARGLPSVVRAPERRSRAASIVVCGHWSTLELTLAPNVLMLDSGCLWGGPLTGGQLADRRVYPGAVASAGNAKAVRIAASASRASSRRCAVPRRQSGSLRSPPRRDDARRTRARTSSRSFRRTYAGRHGRRAPGVAIAQSPPAGRALATPRSAAAAKRESAAASCRRSSFPRERRP